MGGEDPFGHEGEVTDDPDFGEVVEYELTHSFTNPGDGCTQPCKECD